MEVEIKRGDLADAIDWSKPQLVESTKKLGYIALTNGFEDDNKSIFHGTIVSPPFNSPDLMGQRRTFNKEEFRPLNRATTVILKN
jgi:hypothetical protein